MTDLSPAAQAVSDAYETTYTETGLVAAIRELADQVVPHPGRYPMNEYMEGIRNAKHDVRAKILAIATELENEPVPEPLANQIIFHASSTEEVIRLDKEGFHYKGQFIADAGEAHRLMLAFLKQHAKAEQEPPTDDDRWPHL